MQTFFITAGAAVQDPARRVLLKRDPKRGWELPGGHLEAGESLEQCVVREVKEETGIDIAVVGLCGVVHEVGARRCNTFWLARPVGGRVATSAEGLDVGYFDGQEALGMIEREDFREELSKCLSPGRQPFSLVRP